MVAYECLAALLVLLRRFSIRALVLSAGEGTRLRPLTLSRPKPMLPVAGTPVLGHLLRLLAQHHVREVAINLHYRPEVIRSYVGDGAAWGLRVTYSFEPSLLGSAGALKALEAFAGDDDLFILYGDVLTTINLTELAALHRSHGGPATIAVHHVDDPSEKGVVQLVGSGDELADRRVRRFVEKPGKTLEYGSLVNGGIYCLRGTICQQIPPHQVYDFGHDVFPALLATQQPIYAYPTSSYLRDIGNLLSYAEAQVDALDNAELSALAALSR